MAEFRNVSKRLLKNNHHKTRADTMSVCPDFLMYVHHHSCQCLSLYLCRTDAGKDLIIKHLPIYFRIIIFVVDINKTNKEDVFQSVYRP